MPYIYPANYGQIQTQNRVKEGEALGNQFDFSNDGTFNAPTTVAASGWFAVDIRQQTKWKDALNYAPFNAVSISNDSNVNVNMYLNVIGPDSAAKKIFIAAKTDRTYDLAKIVGVTIENLSTTTAIGSGEIHLLFIKSSANVDALAERLIPQINALAGRPPALFERKNF